MTSLSSLLPQLQCQRCGFVSCDAYAQAMQHKGIPGDRCAPGGFRVRAALNAALGSDHDKIDPAYDHPELPTKVIIDETICIGCALCIKACPVDAIVGSGKLMHTVIEAACTGCELCRPVCPVDCITPVEQLPPDSPAWQALMQSSGLTFRQHWLRREGRVSLDNSSTGFAKNSQSSLQEDIQASVARVRARRQNSG
ncbi:MAG: RnfABCDGE type electron transport complex subunit B [Gammaproteobacteria bacterium]